MGTLILDFDGTVTDVDKEAETYVSAYIKGVSRLLGARVPEIMDDWSRIQDVVLANPQTYGWEVNGKIIAPAYAFPYVLMTVIAQQLLKNAGKYQEDALQEVFERCYGLSGTAFRPGAREFFQEVYSRYKGRTDDVCVITNSTTDMVRSKLDILNLGIRVNLVGNARKYDIDDSWTDVPESVDKGFGRPLYLRRKKYFDAMATAGALEGETTVIGDIYELDLLLPQRLGMNIIEIDRPQTWEKEQDAVRETGRVVHTLEEALRYIR